MASLCSSVSQWLRNLEEGDADAAQQLWDRYFTSLMWHVEQRIHSAGDGCLEAEDIAVSVFESLWNGARRGRFQSVTNRDELWWLLIKMTRRKTVSALRRNSRQKRGGDGRPEALDEDTSCGFLDLVSSEPTPLELAVMNEEYRRGLDLLPNQRLKEVAVLTLEGFTTSEISQQLNIAPSSVTRKRTLIRAVWERDLQE